MLRSCPSVHFRVKKKMEGGVMSSETDSRGKTICVGSSQTICDEPTETLRNTFKYYLKMHISE